MEIVNWAFIKGKNAGLKGDTIQKGLMQLGLSCSADYETQINTESWLKGFEIGFNESKQVQRGRRAFN